MELAKNAHPILLIVNHVYTIIQVQQYGALIVTLVNMCHQRAVVHRAL
jgi:hypothetical protein